MPFNPRSQKDIAKLQEAITASRKSLEPFTKTRRSLIELYAGSNYGENSESGSSLLNMMELAVNVYQRLLSSSTPRVTIDTSKDELLPVARELELAVNHILEKELRLGDALNDVVYDAIFMQGILKIGITPRDMHEAEGYMHDAGTVYADAIGAEDWVQDMNAKRMDQMEFCGNRYKVPLESVLDSPLFNKKAKKELEELSSGGMRDGGPFEDNEFDDPDYLSKGSRVRETELRDHVWLWDIWLPYDQLLVTMVRDKVDRPLRIVEWVGPERGPYHILGLAKVPGNLIPLAPAMVWEDLGDLCSRIMEKLAFQAENSKTVLLGQNRARSAMEAVVQSSHGDAMTTDTDPSLIREFNFNGIDGNMLAGLSQFRQMFSYVAGNIDSLGGLSPQSSTLGQDRLLGQAASERMQDYQQKVVDYTRRVVRDISWYIWDDPMVDIPLRKKVTENIDVEFNWNSDSREGRFFDYTFDVEPYSLRSTSPQERLNFVMQMVNQTIMPMMGALQENGMTFDVKEFLKLISRLANTSDLENLIKEETPILPDGSDGETMLKPSSTTRKYVREDAKPGQAIPMENNPEAMASMAQASQEQGPPQ